MTENGRKLRQNQVQAIQMLAAGRPSKLVAEDLGVSDTTLRRWKRQPEFRAELENAQRESIEEYSRLLARAMQPAIAALRQSLQPDKPDHVRLRAASIVTSALLKFHDMTDLTRRVEEIEDTLHGN